MAETHQKIKQYLLDNGISQTHVARESGISLPAMSAILSGNRRLTAEEYVAICNALRVSVSTFTQDGHDLGS